MEDSDKEKTVVISLWSAGSCGRKQLAGILRYVNSGHSWNVRIIMDPKDFTPEVIAEAEADGVDGYIAFAEHDAGVALAGLSTPTVLLSFPSPEIARRKHNLVMIVNDNEDIGRRGAEYLRSLGTFASFAFVPDLRGRGWSRLREESFSRCLAKTGETCRTYRAEDGDLVSWLAALPKPAAVMTPFDFRARDVLEACRKAKIAVPKDVAVIGVDNDDLICEATSPTITSLDIDQGRIGYQAAEILDSLMSAGRKLPSETLSVTSGKIIERESTRPVSPCVHLARRIQACIDDHFKEGITADDVIRELGISRRLADLRMTETAGKTVREALEDRRLEEIKRYLSNTDLPITKITRLCGLENDLWIKYVFKRRFGQTMSEWRRQAKAAGPKA